MKTRLNEALTALSAPDSDRDLMMEDPADLQPAFEALALALYANGATPAEVARIASRAVNGTKRN